MIFPIFLMGNSDYQQIIAEADSAYNAEDYRTATISYEKILEQGMHSPEIYYNLGNAYFNLNNLPSAILNYERAKVLAPRDEDINFNLSIANSMIPDKIEPVPDIFYVQWWKSLRDNFNMNTWTRFSIILFIIVVICAGLFFLSLSLAIRKTAFWAGIFFVLLTAGSFSISYSKYNILSKHTEAIVFDPTITVKSSPNKLGKDLFVIHEGTKVFILEEINDWANIRIANGSSGWMPLSSVKRI
jgi:tetratricopeptide (TPR) repeat protein